MAYESPICCGCYTHGQIVDGLMWGNSTDARFMTIIDLAGFNLRQTCTSMTVITKSQTTVSSLYFECCFHVNLRISTFLKNSTLTNTYTAITCTLKQYLLVQNVCPNDKTGKTYKLYSYINLWIHLNTRYWKLLLFFIVFATPSLF